jgi:hypothetical protein
MLTRVYRRWLALTALGYAVVHHLGLLPDGLGGAPNGTRWADWLDLVVPWVVLAPAALTVAADGASRRTWVLFGVGAGLYFSGHGVHLAANSVGNADPSVTAHLWDERVGHLIWYAGVAVVLAALARTMVGRARPGVVGYALALAVGLTWASNAFGGGTEVLSLVVALAAVWFGWRHRRDLPIVLLVGFAPAAVLIAIGLLI